MSEDIIKEKDLETAEQLQSFFMNFVMTPDQLLFLETSLGAKNSPIWNGGVLGVSSAQRRLHDINNAIRGEKTDYHVKGLTTAELFQIATHIGIPREKAGTKKAVLWEQIKRRISSDLSKEELKWIFAELAGGLKDNELEWLRKNGFGVWKNADLKSEDWVVKNTQTITDLEILIEDIIGMTEKRVIHNHHARLTKTDILAIEKRVGIIPPTSKIFSKGLAKARILKKIQDDIFLRRAGIIDTIPQKWGIV